MKKSTIWTIIVVIIAILLIGIFSSINAKEEAENPNSREEAMENDNNDFENINTKHQYKDGEHVFVGTLNLPTPCNSFNAEVINHEEGENPEIKLTVNDLVEGEICAQVITQKDFKITYVSDNPNQLFDVTLNGSPVELNLFEVSPDENIDTVELFIKG